MRIFYYVQDNTRPSWGIGIIYHHVQILVKNGFEAFILHNKSGFKLPWLDLNVPIKYLDSFSLKKLSSNDIIIFPEVCMDFKGLKDIKCRKILFIQASAFIFESMPMKENHKSLGFSEAFIIMPHMKKIVKNFLGLPSYIIPPFVPNNFLVKSSNTKRKKNIIIYPKFDQIDYSIIKKLLYNKVQTINKKFMGIINIPEWEIVELKGYKHDRIPKLMQNSEIFISINVFEALNTTVIEAMASGCIVFTYDGIGPRDYLIDQENAFVFNNNEAYNLCNKLFYIMDNFEENQEKLNKMREKAYITASHYNFSNMEDELLKTYQNILEN